MKNYNVFISHSWSYSDNYNKIVTMLDKCNFNYSNYSIPKDDPIHNAKNKQDLYNKIENNLKYASYVIILAGVYSTYSEWINKEIEMAKKYGKKIIAIEPWASERTSIVVKNAADKIVGWNYSSIEKAIEELERGV